MAGGSTNLFTSRRTNFIKCEFWNVKKANVDKNEIVNEENPIGTFYAKIENNTISNSTNIVGQNFAFDSNNMSISTNDYIPEMKRNCIVRLEGFDGLWRVDNVEKVQLRSNYQFQIFNNCKTTLSIRR